MEGNKNVFRIFSLIFGFMIGGTLLFSEDCYAAKKKPSKQKIEKKAKPGKSPVKGKPSENSSPATTDFASDKKPEAAPYKKLGALINVGLAPNPLLGFGATVSYYLNPTMAVEGSFLTASGKIEPVAVSATVFGARVKKVFGTIPYVGAGLAMRSVASKWNTLSEAGDEEFESGASSNAIALDLAVGGQFRLGSILLGADVVGIMFPLLKMSNTEQVPEGTYSQSDFDEQKGKFEKINGMNMILFKVGIGIAF
ncbi:MAG: hypothetical protein NT027_18105 [Proteobacteria bacterium]|nr:hypothetical protein [Pseudomonadota bacterium]